MPPAISFLTQILRPPGFGLLTVHTGASAAEIFLAKYFRARTQKNWGKVLEKHWRGKKGHAKQTEPWILGIPSDSGGGICRGAAHGPLALRRELYARDSSWADRDFGDVPCIPQLLEDEMLSRAQLMRSGKALWGKKYRQGLPVSPLDISEAFLFEAAAAGFRVLTLGGDHSVSWPAFKALARARKTRRLAVLHLDAHTDLLESRYGVEHCFGTWTAHALRLLPNPAAWVQIGIRASGRPKRHWEQSYGLKQYWAKELRALKPESFGDRLLKHWEKLGCDSLYTTLDIDGTDGAEAPATGTPEPKGLSPRWVASVLRYVTDRIPLAGADLVEVAPVLGSPAEARRTLKVGADYIEALRWR